MRINEGKQYKEKQKYVETPGKTNGSIRKEMGQYPIGSDVTDIPLVDHVKTVH